MGSPYGLTSTADLTSDCVEQVLNKAASYIIRFERKQHILRVLCFESNLSIRVRSPTG